MLLHISLVLCFLLFNNMSFYEYTQNLFIHSPVYSHLTCFQYLAITIIMLWTFLYKPFYGHTFSFLLSKYLRVELLSHRVGVGVGVCFILLEIATLISKLVVPSWQPLVLIFSFYFSQSIRVCCGLNFAFP